MYFVCGYEYIAGCRKSFSCFKGKTPTKEFWLLLQSSLSHTHTRKQFLLLYLSFIFFYLRYHFHSIDGIQYNCSYNSFERRESKEGNKQKLKTEQLKEEHKKRRKSMVTSFISKQIRNPHCLCNCWHKFFKCIRADWKWFRIPHSWIQYNTINQMNLCGFNFIIMLCGWVYWKLYLSGIRTCYNPIGEYPKTLCMCVCVFVCM